MALTNELMIYAQKMLDMYGNDTLEPEEKIVEVDKLLSTLSPSDKLKVEEWYRDQFDILLNSLSD